MARQSVVHRSLLLVEAERRVGGWVSVETRYFIASHPPRLDTCWRRRGHTGASRLACTGSWARPSGRTSAACARAMHRNLCLLRCLALNLLPQGTTVKTGWPSGTARPAAVSPTWSKSWVSHNLAIARVFGGSQWCRACSIIDAPPDVRHLRRGMRQTALCRSCLNPDWWCADFPHGRSRLTGEGTAARRAAWKL